MTMREVDIALRYSGIRDHNKYAARAALHGHKIPMMSVPKPLPSGPEVDLNDEAAEKAMASALERKKQEMNGGT